MNANLFKAILAMDSYNRGYGEGIILPVVLNTTKIGNATIVIQSDTTASGQPVSADFYGIAYQIKDTNGAVKDTIISYRGTDNFGSTLGGGNDLIYGWTVGAGNAQADQAEMAIKFYQSVAGAEANWQNNSSISLTGHSLGGGLAGLVGAIYDQSGVLFDNMPFELAAHNVYWGLDPASVVLHGGQTNPWLTLNPALGVAVYGTMTPWDVTISNAPTSKLQSYSLDSPFLWNGEVLSNLRLGQQTPETTLSAGSGVNLPDYDALGLHSMSTLILTMWATEKDSNNNFLHSQDWVYSAKYFWSVMYDGQLAQDIGMSSVSGKLLTDALADPTDKISNYADILRQVIAYSAIDEGDVVDEQGNPTNARPFGDTAIRALYDDANDLGAVLKLEGGSENLKTYATEISESFVHYAGLLALNKILNSPATESVLDGVLHFEDMPDGAYLSINFSAAKWGGLNTNVSPQYWLISDGIFKDLSNQSELREQMQILWGDSTTSIFDRALFSAVDTGYVDFSGVVISDTSQASIIIGGSNSQNIIGTNGNDLLSLSGLHNGVMVSSQQANGDLEDAKLIILNFGGNGFYSTYAYEVEQLHLTSYDDTVTLSFSDNYVIDGGDGNDTVTYSDSTDRELIYDEVTGNIYNRDSFVTLINIENIKGDGSLITALVDTQHNGVLRGIVHSLDGMGESFEGVKNSYTLAESGATIQLVAQNTVYLSSMFDGRTRWSEQETVTASVNVNGAQQSGQIYSFYSEQIIYSGDSLRHSGNSTLIGTNHGDHVTMSSSTSGLASYGWIGFISGLGNDEIRVEDDNTKAAVVYTGGDDEIYGHLTQLSLAQDIHLEDISVGSISVSGYDIDNGLYEYAAVLQIANHGSIYIENFAQDAGLGLSQSVQLVLQSQGVALEVSLGGEIYQSISPISYPVLGGGDEVYLGVSRNLQGTADIDNLSGGYKDDVLYGWGGNDILSGNLGDDTIYGGYGDDTIYGDGGDDLIYGEAGANILYGGVGNDTFFMQHGASETSEGGQGNDTYKLSRSTLNATITDTTGSNIIILDDVTASELTYKIQDNSLSVYSGNNKLATITGYQDHFSFSLQSGAILTSQQFIATSSVYVPPVYIPIITYSGYGVTAYAKTDGQTYEYRLTEGNDSFFGSNVKDIIKGYGGNDIFWGYGGDDIIDGGDGRDAVSYYYSHSGIAADLAAYTILDGEGGTDTVTNVEMIYGSFFNDVINGDDSNNYLYGNPGDDVIHGRGGNDEIQGGSGNDYLYGDAGDDLIFWDDGNDFIDGGDGQDGISYYYASSRITADLENHTILVNDGSVDAISNIEILYGSFFNDIINGDGSNNIFYGNGGDDILIGKGGNDIFYGGDGNDTLNGGTGDDTLIGNAGNDTYLYFSGADYIEDTSGAADKIIFDASLLINDARLSGNVLSFINSSNSITFNDIAQIESFSFYGQSDMSLTQLQAYITTHTESSTFIATTSAEHFVGTGASDTVDYSLSSEQVSVDLLNHTALGGYAQGDTFVSIENIKGSDVSSARDIIYGDAANNRIYGLAGYDVLEGGGGADYIDGGEGWDTVRYTRSTSGVSINLETNVNTGGDAEGDTLLNIESVMGSAYNDTLIGGHGSDTLSGGNGNDILIGGKGVDALNGGNGADTFRFLAKDFDGRIDGILDFNINQSDRIDVKDLLSGYDPVTSAITDFVEVTTSGTNTIVKIDRDGSGTSYGWQSIAQLNNVTGLEDEVALRANGTLII